MSHESSASVRSCCLLQVPAPPDEERARTGRGRTASDRNGDKATKNMQNGAKRVQNCARRDQHGAKRVQHGAKGGQRGAKRVQNGDRHAVRDDHMEFVRAFWAAKIDPKTDARKREPKGAVRLKFWIHFGDFFGSKHRKKHNPKII